MKTQEKFVGFDVLKKAVSMIQILEHYRLVNQLHRSGDSLSGACPLHAGHNKSQFRVSISKNCWICFGDCHVGGSIIDFVSRKESVSVREAALLIQEWFGVQPPSEFRSRTAQEHATKANHVSASGDRFDRFGNAPLRFELTKLNSGHRYLTERGLSKETIATFGVGYCNNGSLAGWIAIPIHDAHGRLVAYAGRWPGEPIADKPKYRLPNGFKKSLELFNLHRMTEADARAPLVVVEGFFDCMKVWQAGHRRVVALMGSMLSEAQEELILKAAGPGGKVHLLFDEDEAGRKGRVEARTRLSEWLDVKVITLNPGAQPDQLSIECLQDLLGCPSTE